MTDRPISSQELEMVRWLLERCAFRDVSSFSAQSLEGARVVSGCSCGCSSVDFVQDGNWCGSIILAEAFALWPDGIRAGVMLWARAGAITGIEVYDMDPDSSHRSLTPDVLRRWEDFYPPDPPTPP